MSKISSLVREVIKKTQIFYSQADPKGGGQPPPHCEPSGQSEPGPEHNLVGVSAIGYVSKITVINTIAI